MADTSADAQPANGHAATPHPPPATANATATGKTTTEMPPAKLASAATTTSMAITIDPSRASALHSALSSVLTRIQTASSQRQRSSHPRPLPRLVAVSKLKPASDILALHQPPPPPPPPLPSTATTTPTTPATTTPRQTHFGENYAQELIEKSRLLPRSIKWHMIGGLQSNKCRELARQVRNLWAVESVDSVKKAGLLEKGRAELVLLPREEERQEGEEEEGEEEREEKLRIFVQVNTSGEASKAGVAPDGAELVQLCHYVREQCPHLQLQGLMTIGAIARSQAADAGAENEDFECLKRARERVVRELGLEEELELSMGMSEDFEAAIGQGSDEVRVGTTIFGARPPKGEAKIQ